MSSGRQPSCRSCRTHGECPPADGPDVQAPCGARLAALAAGHLLAPLAAAIVAAALTEGQDGQIAAGASALVAALAVAAGITALVRSRKNKQGL